MRTCIVCIGISQYPSKGLIEGESPLKHASDSAKSISKKFSSYFKNPEIYLLVDQAASSMKFITLLESLSTGGEVENFIFYFAGHGREQSLLLHQGEESTEYAASSLANNIEKVQANHNVVIIDSCYSGTVAKTVSELISSNNFVVSSTSSLDKAWEDEKLKRTVFASVLENELSKQTNLSSLLQLESLFISINKKVAAATYDLKNRSRQEPKIFVNKQNVYIPSNWLAIKKRIWSIALTGMVMLTVSTIIIMKSTHRLGIDHSNGSITLQSGPKYLSFLNKFKYFTDNSNTRFKLFHIVDQELSKNIIEENLWWFKSRRSKRKIPEWLETILSGMNKESRVINEVMLGIYNHDAVHDEKNMNYFNIENTINIFGNKYYDNEFIQQIVARLPRSYPDIKCGDNRNDVFSNLQFNKNFVNIFNDRQFIIANFARLSSSFGYEEIVNQIKVNTNRYIEFGAFFINDRLGYYEAENLFLLAKSIKFRRAARMTDTSNSNILEVMATSKNIEKKCAIQALIWLAYLDSKSNFNLEESLWTSYEEEELVKAEESRVRTKIEQLSQTLSLSTISKEFPEVPKPTIDPLFGISSLVYYDKLTDTKKNVRHWNNLTKKYFESLTFKRPNFLMQQSGEFKYIDNRQYSIIFNLLSKKGSLPKHVVKDLFAQLQIYLLDNTSSADGFPKQFHAFHILKLLATQAIYLTAEDYDQLFNFYLLYDKKIRAPYYQTVLLDPDPSDLIYPEVSDAHIFNLDQILVLLSIRGDLKSTYKSKIMSWVKEDFDKEIDNSKNPLQRYAAVGTRGIRIVAAARLGLGETLSQPAKESIKSYLINQTFGRTVPHPTPSYDNDDIDTNLNLLRISLARNYYDGTRQENRLAEIFNRLKNSINSPENLIIEENIASVWLATLSPSTQDELVKEIRKKHSNEKNVNLKMSLANLLILLKNAPFVYYSNEAKLLRLIDSKEKFS